MELCVDRLGVVTLKGGGNALDGVVICAGLFLGVGECLGKVMEEE